MHATDMETSRLRYDDRPSERFRAPDRKTQQRRRVAGLAAAGLDARLHIRQEGYTVVKTAYLFTLRKQLICLNRNDKSDFTTIVSS